MIKFRAWDNVEKYYISKHTMVLLMEDGTPVWLDKTTVEPFANEIIIEQFTGLHDKYGNEIYEGDLVQYADGITHWDGGYAKPTEVVCKDGSFYPFCGCGGEYSMSTENAEIVGNIHD